MQTGDTNQALLSLFLRPGNEAKAAEYPRSIILCFAIMHPIKTIKTTLKQVLVLKSIVVNHGAYSSDTVKLIVCTLKHL